MKQLLIIASFLAYTASSDAQWHTATRGAKVLAFGVHNTSLFIGVVPQVSGESLVFRYSPTTPSLWVGADNGMDPSLENVTSFASLGTSVFVGMTRTDNGRNGAMYRSTNNGQSWSLVQANGPVATNGSYLFGSGFSTAYRSLDGGKIWSDVLTSFNPKYYAANGSCVLVSDGRRPLGPPCYCPAGTMVAVFCPPPA